ncbi:glycosyltransferase [Arthrobacter halodurans]|uniref:Glycosyltransferase n=1 Tax=Arthrobacter halodurans TaxID=516699 RepID=A0ABV4UKM9_9MICC
MSVAGGAAETPGEEAAGTVAVWRSTLLPPSETFIRHQMDAMSRWLPVAVGLERRPSPVASDADEVVFPATSAGRIRRGLFRRTRWSPAVERRLRSVDARLIHAHFLPEALLISPTARRLGLPLIATAHGYDVNHLPLVSSPRYRRRLRRLFAQAEAVVAVSGFVAGRLAELGCPPGKILRIPIGIPLRPPADRDAAADAAAGRTWDIVFAGRLIEFKGVDHLLRSLADLRGQGRPATLAIVGDGPLRPALEREARELGLEIGVDVDFLGWRPPAGVDSVLRRGRIFCAPSLRATDGSREGFGMVFLEAAAAGLPVVSYRSGGVPEAVADGVTGLLAPEGDNAGLTAHLRTLLDDAGLAARMGSAGRRRVLAEFDVGVRTAALEDAYDRTARRTPGPDPARPTGPARPSGFPAVAHALPAAVDSTPSADPA